ncbi:kanadaptin [Xenentodon cancila]
MAALPLADASAICADEEIKSTVKNRDGSASENGDKRDEKALPEREPQTEDPFKKPTLLAAPSLANKSSTAAVPSAESSSVKENEPEDDEDPAHQAAPGTVCAGRTPSGGLAGGRSHETEQMQPRVHNKREAKPVRPVKGSAAGKFPPLPYSEPPWGDAAPDAQYALEILKNGTVVDTVPLTHRSYFVVGRLPVCDVSLEHPSISRYHAVIQYRGRAGQEGCVGEDRGFYIHDLGSTHGTVVNKNKIPPKTYIRIRVGHVLKFGGSTRLFVLQGPEFDEEEESELTVTQLRERAQKQKEMLERSMLGDFSDGDGEEEKEEGQSNKDQNKASREDYGCTWGMDEDAAPEEDENEENPFSTEFHEDQEAAYLKDPKKALQGFYDREGEELEFEYEDKSHGTWLCRIKLPVDDATGHQLVAEVTHTGRKKEAAVQCCLEACRMLEARGMLRQEAVSRKRKKKNWEDEDYYDSDDDTFLDRTGTVERKRQERMKKAGKIEEKPDTFESLVAKLSAVEKQLEETQKKLSAGKRGSPGSSTEDSLEAFMRSEAAVDGVERRKLHVHLADLQKEAQSLRKLVELTRPAQMPSLLPSGSSEPEKPKKTLPLFGAMKGRSKFKLKTGTIGKLPPKRPTLPAELFNMKELPSGGDEEEEEEEEEEEAEKKEEDGDECRDAELKPDPGAPGISTDPQMAPRRHMKDDSQKVNADIPLYSQHTTNEHVTDGGRCCGLAQCFCNKALKLTKCGKDLLCLLEFLLDRTYKQRRSDGALQQAAMDSSETAAASLSPEGDTEPVKDPSATKKKRVMGPTRPSVQLSGLYPDDDPDYSVWVPPAGQTGDGRTHLNDKYGY